MFVRVMKTLKIAGAALALCVMSTVGATAADTAGYQAAGGTIPVTVDLSNIQTAAGPIYISIQKEDQYRGMRGFGGIIKTAVQGSMSEVYKVDVPGEYSVSVWHDLENNAVFDMDDRYVPQEGYGSSGNAPIDRMPVFEDVKISVPHSGTTVKVDVKYPS